MSDGRQLLLLNLDLSAEGVNEGRPYEGEATVLAVFNVDPAPKLLDSRQLNALDKFNRTRL